MLLLAVVSYGLYLPYRLWYAQGYSSVIPWFGTHTPFWSYFTHWGLFLFVIVSWMVWETRQWMASTPLSSVRKLEKFSGLFVLISGHSLPVLPALKYQNPRDREYQPAE